MSKPDRREILSRVATGTISPEEAATQLDSIHESETTIEAGVRKVRIERQLGALEIVGDGSVREAVAEGPHHARLDGDVMVIEGEHAPETGGFFFGLGRDWTQDTLRIRMNPRLALEFQVQAGNARVRGVEGPIQADIQAGSATIEGFASELSISVQAGSLKASGRLIAGDSRISCDAGSVNLNLERGSSVRITSRASMGKVELPGAVSDRGRRIAREVVVGDGSGALLIETNMGSVKVSADW